MWYPLSLNGSGDCLRRAECGQVAGGLGGEDCGGPALRLGRSTDAKQRLGAGGGALRRERR